MGVHGPRLKVPAFKRAIHATLCRNFKGASIWSAFIFIRSPSQAQSQATQTIENWAKKDLTLCSSTEEFKVELDI